MQEVLKKSLHPKEEMVTRTQPYEISYIPLHVFDIVVNMLHVFGHMLYEFWYFCHVYTSPRPHSVVRCISTIP